MHLSDISNSAAVTLADNKEVIDELINIQDDWLKKYETWRGSNLNNGDNAFDIDEIIQNTYLAQKIEDARNKIKASEETQE